MFQPWVALMSSWSCLRFMVQLKSMLLPLVLSMAFSLVILWNSLVHVVTVVCIELVHWDIFSKTQGWGSFWVKLEVMVTGTGYWTRKTVQNSQMFTGSSFRLSRMLGNWASQLLPQLEWFWLYFPFVVPLHWFSSRWADSSLTFEIRTTTVCLRERVLHTDIKCGPQVCQEEAGWVPIFGTLAPSLICSRQRDSEWYSW